LGSRIKFRKDIWVKDASLIRFPRLYESSTIKDKIIREFGYTKLQNLNIEEKCDMHYLF